MRIINYSIEVEDVQGKQITPILKYCGVYPSEAFKTPQELAQSIMDFLNEEFGLRMFIAEEPKEINFDELSNMLDSVSTVMDLDSVQARQERIAKNKRELGF